MKNEYVLAGLIRKRAEIAGELEEAQGRVRKLMVALDSVDATIRLFAPDLNTTEIRPKPLPPRHGAFRGEAARTILDALREAGEPLTTKDLALRSMMARGLDVADPDLVLMVRKRVGAGLRHLRERGVVQSQAGKDGSVWWRLSA